MKNLTAADLRYHTTYDSCWGELAHPAHAVTLDGGSGGGGVVSGMWVVAVREVGGGVAQLAVRLEGANGVDKQALEGLMPTVRSGGSCGASSPWWGRRRVWGIGPALGDDTRHRNCRNRDAALGHATPDEIADSRPLLYIN